MGKSCSIAAHVRNSNGEIVESKLFNDLLSFTGNRESAQNIWALSQVPEIMSKLNIYLTQTQTQTNSELIKKLKGGE